MWTCMWVGGCWDVVWFFWSVSLKIFSVSDPQTTHNQKTQNKSEWWERKNSFCLVLMFSLALALSLSLNVFIHIFFFLNTFDFLNKNNNIIHPYSVVHRQRSDKVLYTDETYRQFKTVWWDSGGNEMFLWSNLLCGQQSTWVEKYNHYNTQYTAQDALNEDNLYLYSVSWIKIE